MKKPPAIHIDPKSARRQRAGWARLVRSQPDHVIRDAELMDSTPRLNRHNEAIYLEETGQMRKSFPDDAGMYDRVLYAEAGKKKRK